MTFALALGACGTDPAGAPFEPGEARLLSVDSPTKDEDPSVLAARDGTLLVAWFSDRGGNPDIYLSAWVQGPEGAQDVYYRFFER